MNFFDQAFYGTDLKTFDDVDSINKNKLIAPLYIFDKPFCLYNWSVVSDQIFGGS